VSSMSDPVPHVSRRLVGVAAIAALVFYAATAHLTRGHEADFGKQWLAMRLVAMGQARSLYDPVVQRAELDRHFSREVIERGIWREGIGGPTYPPTFAVLLAPLGLLPPAWAQWLVVELSLVAVLLSAWSVYRLSNGGLDYGLAVLMALVSPNFFLAIGLGQNSAFSLAVLAIGWSLLARQRDLLAGAVWGIFALKPTWGLAIVWLPAAVRRPRAYIGMALSAGLLALLTLPVCGLGVWLEWLRVAGQTERYYQALPRWIALSRDVPGVLRRFGQGEPVELAGYAVLVLIGTVTVWTWRATESRGRMDSCGPRAVALLAGCILTCPRFMFYDLTLAILPAWLGLAAWRELGTRGRWMLGSLLALFWVGAAVAYTRWQMLGPPLDTWALGALWAWAIVESHAARMDEVPLASRASAPVPSEAALVAETT
jgi:hypothetical protein